MRFHSFPKDKLKKKNRGVTLQEGQVSGLLKNSVLSLQNILKPNTFHDKSEVIMLFPVSIIPTINSLIMKMVKLDLFRK